MSLYYEVRENITESEGFRIENDQQAEWAMRKIIEAKAEVERWERFYTEKLMAVVQREQDTINYMTSLLMRYFDTQERRVTKSGIEKYSLPSGTLERRPAGIKYESNEEELLAWCEKNLPDAIKTTRKASWSAVKDYIKETGEIPGGVTVGETEPSFTVKESKNA